MKLMSEVASNLMPETKEHIAHLITVIGGFKELDHPAHSSSLECPICSSKQHHIAHVGDGDQRKIWICGNNDCAINLTVKQKISERNVYIAPHINRAIQWPKFCEINGIGDIHYNVRFEDVKQSQGKIEYMRKFANTPFGIIRMQGDGGTGKTYASMAICELYTRRDISCIFTTHERMLTDWLATFNIDKASSLIEKTRISNYIETVRNVSLLVIDDFGTAEPSPGFMRFFMDLINSRIQWKNKGTIITTNLKDNKLAEFCGDALFDRINTGQVFLFEGPTRRRKNPL